MNPFELFLALIAGTPFEDFADVPVLAEIPDGDLATVITDLEASIAEVAQNPLQYVTADLTTTQLLDVTKAAVECVKALKAELETRQAAATEAFAEAVAPEVTPEVTPEVAEVAEVVPEAAAATEEDPAPDPDAPDPDPDPDAAAVTAAAGTGRQFRPRPDPSRELVERETQQASVALVAAGGTRDMNPGTPFKDELDLAYHMIRRHDSFGREPGAESFAKFSIARADWRDSYDASRTLSKDEETNWGIVTPVINPRAIQTQFASRVAQQDRDLGIVASGGLCAPVTPYYNLQFISVPTRPVMASLPSFVADRGGLRYARPAALSAVTDAVGIITEAEDAAGGSSATKTCQVIPCPEFQETDVDILYHCLQFGNLGARTFPELVAQWNNLVLAAHARLAESNLLTLVDGFSTQVTAGHLGMGASATLFSQIAAAANGLRSRNRMNPDAVLRIMLPFWAVDLIVSDVIRSQFQRFDTDQAKVVALLRSFNIEPTFYIDGASGRSQVFGAQTGGALLAFPSTVVWYLFPEGSFLYLDGGTLELGIVRDSVLNKTNDFQIFGETFESVAFVGVESLAVESTVCDSGTVSLPASLTCPIDYSMS